MEVVQVPQAHVAEKTVEIRQLDVIEKIVETPEIQTGAIASRAESSNVLWKRSLTPPIPLVVAEASKAFSHNRVQHSSMEQAIANPNISRAEKTVQMPDTRTQIRHNMS